MDWDKDMGNKCLAIFQTLWKMLLWLFLSPQPPLFFLLVVRLFAFQEAVLDIFKNKGVREGNFISSQSSHGGRAFITMQMAPLCDQANSKCRTSVFPVQVTSTLGLGGLWWELERDKIESKASLLWQQENQKTLSSFEQQFSENFVYTLNQMTPASVEMNIPLSWSQQSGSNF